MKKEIKIGLLIAIILLVIGLISIKKGSKTNVILIGQVRKTDYMNELLLICDSRSFSEAEEACKMAKQPINEEINNLCKMRFDNNMSMFTNKCLRFYKLVDRVRDSQNKVSDYLTNTKHDHLIIESMTPVNIPGFDSMMKKCVNHTYRPFCLLEADSFFIDGWFKEKYVDYLFDDRELKSFISTHPNFEKDITACKDYQGEDKCKIMNDFLNLHLRATQRYLNRTRGKNVIVIMGQEHMNYISCKNFDKNRYNCKDVLL